MTIFYTVGVWKTATICINLFYMYRTGETTSNVTFMNNQTFSLPASTICLPINIQDIKFIETPAKKSLQELNIGPIKMQ